MRTADLPIGAHVCYDRSGSRNYPSYVEAFVFAHRPRGNKSSYWGRTGNTDTIGLAYRYPWAKTNDGQPVWDFTWARPADIHMTWDEYAGIEAANAKRKAEREAADKAAKRDRRKRVNALPVEFLKVLDMEPDGWRRDDIINRDYVNVTMSVDKLEALVAAAQNAVPERRAARVASEVEAALRLLAG